MDKKISVVINTFNEERNIAKAIKSVDWADEIFVCDMYSQDKTAEIAKKMGAKVVTYRSLKYVEPARNFAISKTLGDWILVLDPDEEIPESLKMRLIQIAGKMEQINYVRIPRKNIIFNKWMQTTGWWPDYNIRFFKKGKVRWTDKIHRPPEVSGVGIDLPAEEKWAIIHHNYQTISQFVERMNRYTTIEAEQLRKEGYKFNFKDLLRKPLNEFLSRFFASHGYEDGLHGLALSFLQALSCMVVYLKIWEMSKFKEYSIETAELDEQLVKSGQAITYWMKQSKSAGNPPRRSPFGHLRGVAKRLFGRE